jgi:hypothetical protein
MSKQSGLGDNLYVGGYNLSGDVQAVGNVGGGCGVLDVTSIDKSAYERIGGLRDGRIEMTTFFNPASSRAHPVLSALPRTDVNVTYARGTTIGSPAASLVAKQIGYEGTRAADGMFTFGVSAQANSYGLVWGQLLTAGLRTDTTATNGTGLDTTASASFGWSAFLHLTAFTGTNVTVAIEDSADNASWSALSGASFGALTGVGAVRVAGATSTATVRRYVRAVTSGTFTSATFAVVLHKGSDPGTVF